MQARQPIPRLAVLPRPQAPEPLHCHQCLDLLPADGAVTMEMTDYVQYYCGLGCLDAWLERRSR